MATVIAPAKLALAACALFLATGAACSPNAPNPPTPIEADPLAAVAEAELWAPDGAQDDFFGGSVSIDLETIAVGVSDDATSVGENAGSVYVFVRNALGGTWSQEAQLFADDAAAGDSFGFSVALSGDTLVVGAPGDDTGTGMDAGSAYVFVRAGGQWSQQARLFPSTPRELVSFGIEVAASGETVAVGSRAQEAYVFVRATGAWSEEAPLTPGGAPANPSGFGQALALDGDTLVVGAAGDETRGYGAGSVYVFARASGTWSQAAQLFASDAAIDDGFGAAVAVRREVMVVGALGDDTPGGSNAGSAYVFRRSSGTWQEEARLLANDGADGDYFGNAVAVDGDVAVVTAVGADRAVVRAGSAYAFARDPTSGEWARQAEIVPQPAGDTRVFQFGTDASLQASTVVVGSMNDIRMSMPNAGSAYVFLIQGGTGGAATPSAAGGCGCRAAAKNAGGSTGTGALWTLGALLCAAVARRRRRS